MKQAALFFLTVVVSLFVVTGAVAGDITLLSAEGSPAAVNPVTEKAVLPGTGPILLDQAESLNNPGAYASHDFDTPMDFADIFIAEDFEVPTAWMIGGFFVPGTMSFESLTCANALHWQVYNDAGGVPDGDPRGRGNAPLWSISLSPTDPQIVLGDRGGLLTDVTLLLDQPIMNLSAGTYWLVFYPEMDFGACGEWFWRPSDTSNGNPAQVVNPDGGLLPLGVNWTAVHGSGGFGIFQQDFALRIIGTAQPAFGFDIKVNFDDGPVMTAAGGRNIISVSFNPSCLVGTPAEYWVLAATPFGTYSYRVGKGWSPGRAMAYQGPLVPLSPRIVYDGKIPKGTFNIYFILDFIVNGDLDVGSESGFYDRVKLTVN